MEQEVLIEKRKLEKTKPGALASGPLSMHPWLLLASITAFFCLQLEVAVLEQIDSLSLYMTKSEIVLDALVALLLVLGMAGVWWGLVSVISLCGGLLGFDDQAGKFAWIVGLLVPFSYFVLTLVSATKTLLFPHSQAAWFKWLLLGAICIACALKVRIAKLQTFCRTRLAPIAWVHLGVGIVAVGVLWAHGVHLFENYQHADQRAAASSQLPDIYLISFDALAAEDMSLYGYPVPTTPNLDRFAQQSFTFDYFFANSNFTAASSTSIETGKLPWTHRIFHQGGFLRGEAQGETLAAELHRRGYYTAMITANQWAAPFRHRTLSSYDAVDYEVELGTIGALYRATNLIGVNTQYTIYGALFQRLARGLLNLDALLWPERYPGPAEPVFNRAKKLLDDKSVASPRFLWTHILPPHDPYLPPPLTKKHFLPSDQLTRARQLESLQGNQLPPGTTAAQFRARYDEMVLYGDAIVGDYLDWLQQTGKLDHAIVIVTADHGESFEHNTFLHGGPALYEGMIRVPLIIHLPGQKQGEHISQPGQQADLLATVLDLIGGRAPGWTDGESLKPVMDGQTLSPRYIYSMNLESARIFDPIAKAAAISVRDETFKYMVRLGSGEEALYRYREDPSETQNLITSDPEVAARMRGVLFNQLKQVNERPRPSL